ncbi:MAG: class I SAM-dependent methyltransferase [Acidobacteriota bacterium]|nr:class I SAM-dependent methyltransferase [Acidobacteriota bacterium]
MSSSRARIPEPIKGCKLTAIDIRMDAARYYDLNPLCPEDFAFYRKRLPSPRSSVLELGCGTGRILLPMALECAFIQGVDISEAMISICRDKLDNAGGYPGVSLQLDADLDVLCFL